MPKPRTASLLIYVSLVLLALSAAILLWTVAPEVVEDVANPLVALTTLALAIPTFIAALSARDSAAAAVKSAVAATEATELMSKQRRWDRMPMLVVRDRPVFGVGHAAGTVTMTVENIGQGPAFGATSVLDLTRLGPRYVAADGSQTADRVVFRLMYHSPDHVISVLSPGEKRMVTFDIPDNLEAIGPDVLTGFEARLQYVDMYRENVWTTVRDLAGVTTTIPHSDEKPADWDTTLQGLLKVGFLNGDRVSLGGRAEGYLRLWGWL